MDDGIWKKLEADFEEFPFSGAESVPMEEIHTFEQSAGFTLPADYAEFIHRFGGGYIGACPIYGLRRCKSDENQENALLTKATQHYRDQKWPGLEDSWLVIGNDHFGNPFCIDTDGKFWVADHDVGRAIKAGDSFEEFIRNECLNDD